MQCKDIDDALFLRIVEALGAAYEASGGPHWAFRRDVESELAKTYPWVNDKLTLAKAVMLERRGLMHGCMCGCRGDFELTEKGFEFLQAKGTTNVC